MSKKKYRLELTYDPIHNETLCILWDGMLIANSKYTEGDNSNIPQEQKDNIKKELIDESRTKK